MINDPISDMLTRLRNAIKAKHTTVRIVNTKINKSIASILWQEGMIKEAYLVTKNKTNETRTKTKKRKQKEILITLKYLGPFRRSCITQLNRLSCSSLRVYSGYKDIPDVLGGMGLVILSTPKGIMTDRQARQERVGGEILCSIW